MIKAVRAVEILGLDEILGGILVFPLSIAARPFSASAKGTLSLSTTVEESIIVPFAITENDLEAIDKGKTVP